MVKLAILSVILLLQGVAVQCFAPSAQQKSVRQTTAVPVFASTTAFRSFLNADDETPQQKLLKQVEREEANLKREREKAKERLEKYDQSLEVLQTKKAQYMVQTDAPTTFTETTLRSAVKAFCWRIIAGSVTFITTLRFSGSMKTALQVVGADFLSKSLTMFIGERLMNKSKAGRTGGADDAGRSLAKALIWRLFAICNTLTMAVFVSKDLSVASKIASTDAVFKTALMFVYERVWARIEWGKEYEMQWNL
mmetsp:Transcript_24069/g.50051  ORF Transcript_24069/g.50051 Transcript_24069/m.50051 type:complete len:251 (+) Transcript_24069:931-1683(+)